MNLKPEELEEAGYSLYEKIEHHDIIPFVRKYLRQWTPSIKLYIFFNIAFLGVLTTKVLLTRDLGCSGEELFAHISYGVALSFLLVPLHEYIHVLAYRSQGARNTSYGANLRKLYFYAVADRFVADRKEFRIIALAPFISISTLFITLAFVATPLWSVSFLSVLAAHASMCAGDFALLSYFDVNRKKQMITWDDAENKISYFLGKESI